MTGCEKAPGVRTPPKRVTLVLRLSIYYLQSFAKVSIRW